MGLIGSLQGPLWDVLPQLLMLVAPLWIAVCFGVLVGWIWRPSWANSSTPINSYFVHLSNFNSIKSQFPRYFFPFPSSSSSSISFPDTSSSCKVESQRERKDLMGEDELEHISKLVEEKDEGPAWIQMMERSTSDMTYQAWRRDPQSGPPQYRTRTVYEDTSPQVMRDFFWDDEFRLKWDDMLIDAQTLEECTDKGTMVVKWVRKFPFFCSDREYIIGRRIWESGQTYYCVTKGVEYPSVPSRNKPRRVDLYYSSWMIRAVESRKGDGKLSACEVLLFHHEDMGIPWELAKLGVRQGMWGAVTKVDRGLRSYQKHIASGAPLSHSAYMAHINTKVSSDRLRYLENARNGSQDIGSDEKKPSGRNIHKILVVGGAIALACTLDQGILTKALIFGVARRFTNIGRRL